MMRLQTVAGWVAFVAGFSLATGTLLMTIGVGVSGGGAATGGMPWPMAHGMMAGAGHMGGGMGGMMGFGDAGPGSTPIPGAIEVRVEATNFSFSPTEIRLPKGAEVNLTLANPATTGVVHDLTVPTLGIHIAANAGQTRTVGLRGLTAGRYDAYCGVPGHADLGMRATLIVE